MDQLFTLWTLWWNGPPPPEADLWDLPLYWWARIGKLLQVFAILSVLFEIIGAERLRAFARPMLKRSSLSAVVRQAYLTARTPLDLFARFANEGYSERKLSGLLANVYDFAFVGVTLVLWPVATWQFISEEDFYWVPAVGIGLLSAMLTTTFVALGFSLLWGLMILLGSVLLILPAALVILPMAYLIASPRLDVGLRVVTLLAAVVGLHFDLLAS